MVLLAGGSGTRMGLDGNKVYLPLAGRPALAFPLATLSAAADVAVIVIVARAGDEAAVEDVLAQVRSPKVGAVVPGGVTRHASEQAGLAAVRSLMAAGVEVAHILVHDGARPFVTLDLLAALMTAARRVGGAIPALPLPTTVFVADGACVTPRVAADLVTVQTPQVFRADALLAAYAAALTEGFDGVDTAQVVEHYAAHLPAPVAVAAVPGDERNLKVTTPADIDVAEHLAGLFTAGRWRDRPGPQPS